MICLKYVWIIAILICDGVKEEIGSLEMDNTHIGEPCYLPIDMSTLDFKKIEQVDKVTGRVDYI